MVGYTRGCSSREGYLLHPVSVRKSKIDQILIPLTIKVANFPVTKSELIFQKVAVEISLFVILS